MVGEFWDDREPQPPFGVAPGPFRELYQTSFHLHLASPSSHYFRSHASVTIGSIDDLHT